MGRLESKWEQRLPSAKKFRNCILFSSIKYLWIVSILRDFPGFRGGVKCSLDGLEDPMKTLVFAFYSAVGQRGD